jgi:glyoxylate carboligase
MGTEIDKVVEFEELDGCRQAASASRAVVDGSA